MRFFLIVRDMHDLYDQTKQKKLAVLSFHTSVNTVLVIISSQ